MSGLIFISYSHTDGTIVTTLHHHLEEAGLSVWVDHAGLRVGTPDWEEAIRRAIRDSRAVIFVASPEAYQSRYVRGELAIAEMYQRPVFPLWVAGEVWADCVPLHLISAHYADARYGKYDEALANLLRSLKTVPELPDYATLPLTPHQTNFIPRNPYKGLRAFTSRDQRDFFGRETFIEELLQDIKMMVRPNHERFLGILGSSGAGKSSLVMAGLIPRLQAGAVPNSQHWIYLPTVFPGLRPLEALADVLADTLNLSIKRVMEDLDSTRGLHLLAKRMVRESEGYVVLVIDQLEELFTQTIDAYERTQFIDLLVTAATEADGVLLPLVTLRADFYDRPMDHHGLGKLLEQSSRSILPMRVADLRDVIEKPAQLPDVQLIFEEGLVGDLLFDVRGQAGSLPLLQFALDQLVERRRGNLLTHDAYAAMGGVRGAIASHADAVYESLPDEVHQELTRVLFLRMIEPGETDLDTTRRRVPTSDLTTSDSEQTHILSQLIEIFTHQRLLTTNKIGSISTIEVSHEALIREWGRLADWVRTAREDIRLQRIINNDATEWLKRGKRPDDLYRGAKLAEARLWAERSLVSLNERDFIDTAIRAEEELLAEKFRTETMQQQATVLRQRVYDLQQITTAVSRGLDYQKVLDTVLDLGASIVHEKKSTVPLVSAVLLFDNSTQLLKVVNSRGLSEEDKQVVLPADDGILFHALQQVDPVFDTMPDPELNQIQAFRGCQSLLAIPLQAGLEYYGVLLFGSADSDGFSDDDAGLIKDIGIKTTIALQNSVQYQMILQERERVVSVEEDTRKKLARDLHDGPTQSIAAITMRLNYIRRVLKKDPDGAIEELAKVEEIARRTTKEIRHMLFLLRPLILESQGLTAALRHLGEKIHDIYGFNVLVDADAAAERLLDNKIQGVTFYIVEEAANNAGKHAQPSTLWIRLFTQNDQVILEVEDDGVGFESGAVAGNYSQRGSLGMVNIRERAELIDAAVQITSVVGKGTKIRVMIPVNPSD